MNAISKLMLAICLLVLSGVSHAVTCRATNTSIVQAPPVTISRSIPAGNVVWKSAPQTAHITCTDTNGMPQGENARIYIDPQHEFAQFLSGTNMKLVINIDGREYDQPAQVVPTNYQATIGTRGGRGCNMPTNNNRSPNNICRAQSNSFTFTYTLSLVTTHALPTVLPPMAGRRIDKVFVVDGVGGINACNNNCNTTNNRAVNFGPGLTMSTITYNNCTLNVSISSDRGDDVVDFGKISILQSRNGADSSHRKQFAVIATDTSPGHECKGLDFALTFSGANTNNGTVFTGTGTPDIGVTLQDAALTNLPDIISGQRIDFTSNAFTNQDISRRKEFMATLFWLKNPPQPGSFSIPVTATITFK